MFLDRPECKEVLLGFTQFHRQRPIFQKFRAISEGNFWLVKIENILLLLAEIGFVAPDKESLSDAWQ